MNAQTSVHNRARLSTIVSFIHKTEYVHIHSQIRRNTNLVEHRTENTLPSCSGGNTGGVFQALMFSMLNVFFVGLVSNHGCSGDLAEGLKTQNS